MSFFKSAVLRVLAFLVFPVSQCLLADGITPSPTIPEVTATETLSSDIPQPTTIPTLKPPTFDYPSGFPYIPWQYNPWFKCCRRQSLGTICYVAHGAALQVIMKVARTNKKLFTSGTVKMMA